MYFYLCMTQTTVKFFGDIQVYPDVFSGMVLSDSDRLLLL
jgi:hypothetical protein